MIVLDASAWVTALVDAGDAGQEARRLMAADPGLLAPAHCRLEVTRTLVRYEQADLIAGPALAALVEALLGTQVREVPADEWLLRVTWRLRHNVGVYDAPYLAVAERYGAPLITCDARLARAAEPLGVDVRLLS